MLVAGVTNDSTIARVTNDSVVARVINDSMFDRVIDCGSWLGEEKQEVEAMMSTDTNINQA